MSGMSRRMAIGILTGGVATVAIGGAVVLRPPSQSDLVRRTLERYLGPVRIPADDLEAFTADFSAQNEWVMLEGKLADGYDLATTLGLGDPAIALLPGEDKYRIELFERRVLGAFYSTTDFGWRESAQDEVSYLGAFGCSNPFARLNT